MSIIKSDYRDLGLVIDTTNMAAGATVWSNSIDNVQWVRNIIIFAQSDQQFDLKLIRKDSSGVYDWGTDLKPTIAATGGAGNWISYTFTAANVATASALLGAGVKFGIKNSSASPNTFARIKVQLMGI